jgi:hypothetical protein
VADQALDIRSLNDVLAKNRSGNPSSIPADTHRLVSGLFLVEPDSSSIGGAGGLGIEKRASPGEGQRSRS